eukprot:scaffold1603_cov415-Prasinococcus_capsulatus_cf.AAC.13
MPFVAVVSTEAMSEERQIDQQLAAEIAEEVEIENEVQAADLADMQDGIRDSMLRINVPSGEGEGTVVADARPMSSFTVSTGDGETLGVASLATQRMFSGTQGEPEDAVDIDDLSERLDKDGSDTAAETISTEDATEVRVQLHKFP